MMNEKTKEAQARFDLRLLDYEAVILPFYSLLKLFLMLLVQRAFSIWIQWKNFVEFKSQTRFEFDLIGEFDQTLQDIQWICFYYLLIFGDPGQENP